MSDSNLTEAQREQVARAKQAAEELAAEKSDIPDALKPLVETHEEDGSPVGVCGYPCSETYLMGDLRRVWGAMHRDAENGEITLLSNRSSRKSAACPYCGTLVGFLADGTPYRIRHSRVVEALEHRDRALEWLATECKLLIEPRVHSVEQIVAGALAATKEVPDGHDAAAGA